MHTVKDFEIKQRKYMPVFPKASGKTTVYIEGYPGEDDEPMAATGFHGAQITTLYDQLKRYFHINDLVSVGVDSLIYFYGGTLQTVAETQWQKEAKRRLVAGAKAVAEAIRQHELRTEIERLRAQLANLQDYN